VIEEHEEQIEKQMLVGERRTKAMYVKDDPLDSLADKILRNIERIDDNIGTRMEEMDQDAVRYMKELAQRNAQWSMRLKEVDAKITRSARSKSTVVWNERMAQKDLNENYEPVYSTNDYPEAEVWDAGSTDVEGTPQNQQGEMIEIVEEVQRKPRRRTQTAKQQPRKKPQSKKQSRQQSRTSQQAKARPQPQARERTVREAKETQYRKQKTQSYQPAISATKTATASSGTQQKIYPCPSCQKPLTYYDKYQRWWCRSCKKWR